VIKTATSTGPQPAHFDRCDLDEQSQPSGSEYAAKPKLAPPAQQLSLPVGRTDEEGAHKEKL